MNDLELLRMIADLQRQIDALKTQDVAVNNSITRRGFVTTAPNDTTKFWRGDASWAVPPVPSSNPVILFASTTETTSNGAEQTAYTFSIPGGTLSTNNILRVRMVLDMSHSAVAAATMKLLYGATTLFTITVNTLGSNDGVTEVIFYLKGNGATNSQRGTGSMISVDVGFLNVGYGTGTAAEDSTAAKNLVIKFNSANAGNTWISRLCTVEKIVNT